MIETTTKTEPRREYVRGNVIRNKQTGRKKVCFTPFTDEKGEYEFVCEDAHDDGDFSYLCTNEYCRCYQ